MVALLLLGSNVGDRAAHLRRAAAGLSGRVLARSRVYETAPVGPSRRPFLNQALKLDTPLSPMGLLIEAKRLEAAAGRRPGPRWGPRPLDVDIVTYGALKIRTPLLVVPHPEAKNRAFAAAPLAELSPAWSVVWTRLKPKPGTVRIYSRGNR